MTIQRYQMKYGSTRMGRQDLSQILKKYPINTALIRYTIDGKIKVWAVGADNKRDNESTLRGHLMMHIPKAVFVEWAIK